MLGPTGRYADALINYTPPYNVACHTRESARMWCKNICIANSKAQLKSLINQPESYQPSIMLCLEAVV